MIVIFVVFVLTTKSMIREAAGGPRGPSADKNADLLEVIKLNLRNNNDDYTDRADLGTSSSVPSDGLPALTRYMRHRNKSEHFNKNKKGLRRANDEVLMDSYVMDNVLGSDKYNVAVNSTDTGPRNTFKRNNDKLKPINSNIIDKHQQTDKTIAKGVPLTAHMRTFSKSKANKIEKIKKFYEKNKDLLKEFLSSKIAARTQTAKTTQKPGLRQRQRAVGNGVMSRQDWLGNGEGGTEPPNPDLLDMLPAVGGRIHFRRIEGRLCHRHVVVPEGPKYDSAGRVYLAAHAAKVRRPYNVTRRPRMLLPKCCNCCKKSVLGCE